MNRKDIEKITAARLGVPVTTVEPFVQAFFRDSLRLPDVRTPCDHTTVRFLQTLGTNQPSRPQPADRRTLYARTPHLREVQPRKNAVRKDERRPRGQTTGVTDRIY